MKTRYLAPNDFMADPAVHVFNGRIYIYPSHDRERYSLGGTPVVGWTTHHSIVEFKNKWYLFHHDCVPSGGKTWLRSLKAAELFYNEDGTIQTINGTAG